MTVLAVAAASLRRMLRDRISMFFVVLLPVVVILIIGATVGGVTAVRLGVVAADTGPLSADLVAELRAAPSTTVHLFAGQDAARTALRRKELDAVVVVPAGTDAALRRGGAVSIPVLEAGAAADQQAVRATVAAAVARHAARVQAAGFAAEQAGGTLPDRLAGAARLQPGVPAIGVRTSTVDSASDILPAGFGYSAPTMLVLFVFVNTLAAGAAMIQTRRLGIYSRAMAAPVRARDIVLGEGLCYLSLALLQSALIVTVGAVLFGVHWGAPAAAAALIGLWALVGTGAGMLSGTVFRTPEQASGIGPAVGIAFGMLGGCMWPLAIVSPVMRTIGHLVPQAWAVDAWTRLVAQGGGIGDIAGQLGVLAAFAAALLGLASLRLRRRLAG
jgi:ABC-2 type transport system permease protein